MQLYLHSFLEAEILYGLSTISNSEQIYAFEMVAVSLVMFNTLSTFSTQLILNFQRNNENMKLPLVHEIVIRQRI